MPRRFELETEATVLSAKRCDSLVPGGFQDYGWPELQEGQSPRDLNDGDILHWGRWDDMPWQDTTRRASDFNLQTPSLETSYSGRDAESYEGRLYRADLLWFDIPAPIYMGYYRIVAEYELLGFVQASAADHGLFEGPDTHTAEISVSMAMFYWGGVGGQPPDNDVGTQYGWHVATKPVVTRSVRDGQQSFGPVITGQSYLQNLNTEPFFGGLTSDGFSSGVGPVGIGLIFSSERQGKSSIKADFNTGPYGLKIPSVKLQRLVPAPLR